MSHEIVKSIVPKDDSVYITSATNNVSPRTFEKWHSDAYDEIYRQRGLTGFLEEFAKGVWNGDYQLINGSKYVNALNMSFTAMNLYGPDLRHFLDVDRGSRLIAAITVKYLDTHQFEQEDFEPYEALRSDAKAVLDVCKKNPGAFAYAAASVQADRDTAKTYIALCSSHLDFYFPSNFNRDKELAIMALQSNGCIYRMLDSSLQQDRDIIRLAYADNIPNRTFHEHLPDLISPDIRKDAAFMREIVSSCPQLHLLRAPDILEDRDTAFLAAQVCTPSPYVFRFFPEKYLEDTQFQSVFFSRCTHPLELELLKMIYTERGIEDPFPASIFNDQERSNAANEKPLSNEKSNDLNAKIANASVRAKTPAGEGREAPAATLDTQVER